MRKDDPEHGRRALLFRQSREWDWIKLKDENPDLAELSLSELARTLDENKAWAERHCIESDVPSAFLLRWKGDEKPWGLVVAVWGDVAELVDEEGDPGYCEALPVEAHGFVKLGWGDENPRNWCDQLSQNWWGQERATEWRSVMMPDLMRHEGFLIAARRRAGSELRSLGSVMRKIERATKERWTNG